jgi:hypothetical protein
LPPGKILFLTGIFGLQIIHFPGKDIPAPETGLESVLGFLAIPEWSRENREIPRVIRPLQAGICTERGRQIRLLQE